MKTGFRPLLAMLALVAVRLAAAYLPAGTPDTIALLAPPPTAGSGEDKSDLENTFVIHTTATPAELARAKDENKLTIFLFAPGMGPWFAPGKMPRTEALFKAVEAEPKAATEGPKKFYKRPHPSPLWPQPRPP